MNRQVNVSTWIPLASVQRLAARGKLARTRDGQQGIVLYFIGRCVVLRTYGGKKATAAVNECEIMQSKQG